MENIHAGRIAAIRTFMQSNELDAVIIMSYDPHSSEYCAPRWQQMQWASGFTGEAGCMAVTMDHVGLWTDSRYYIQAEKQLHGSGITLHKAGNPSSRDMFRWLAEQDGINTVGVDGLCLSLADKEELGMTLKDFPDMLSACWTRPEIPTSTITALNADDTGYSRRDKITWLRDYMNKEGFGAVVVSALDEIAWLLNIRGGDIEYNPYVISYLVVGLDRVVWFVKKAQTEVDSKTEKTFAELRLDGIEIGEYDDVNCDVLRSQPNRTILVDSSSMNYHIEKLLHDFGEVQAGTLPIQLAKAVKTDAEIRNFRKAYLEDGLALEKFLFWVEKEVASGRKVSEWEASEKLTSLRSEIPGYCGNSFENISAYGANAALPHYSTPSEGSAILQPRGLYLVDSGGQYLFGTTDTTRTVPLGECSHLEKEDYTLVLRGMIQLSMAVFPRGTAGCQIDVLARNALWRNMLNYGHGTGHGIGFYLGVHEGPQTIRQNFNKTPMLPGMVTSNEPGIYREGQHGVRHENVVLCVEAGVNDFGDWLAFETLTLCHIDTSAVLPELMTADEIEWLNNYNARVYETLAPQLPEDIAVWLGRKTAPIQSGR